jgi:type II secretory pathway pseudopilin PulG
METTMTKERFAGVSQSFAKRQAGFSLLEVVIAGAIITIGLLAVLGLFGTALAATQSSQLDEIAHARATQALESIYTARQTNQLGFGAIDNTTTGTGIFTPGMVALSDPGPDGIDGTADDVTPPAPIVLPGPDGVLGTADDKTVSLAAFKRQIQITNALDATGAPNPNLKQVVVTIQYPGQGGRTSTYTVQSLISAFR